MTTTWAVPDRTEPPSIADERPMLESWLDYHRDTLLTKCADLPLDRLTEQTCPPSTLSLLGLLRHMAEVERWWFRIVLGADLPELYCTPDAPDGDFDGAVSGAEARALADFTAEVAAARRSVADRPLDEVVTQARVDGSTRQISVRWIFIHMIEEYARHNGHADLLRERTDGSTGD